MTFEALWRAVPGVAYAAGDWTAEEAVRAALGLPGRRARPGRARRPAHRRRGQVRQDGTVRAWLAALTGPDATLRERPNPATGSPHGPGAPHAAGRPRRGGNARCGRCRPMQHVRPIRCERPVPPMHAMRLARADAVEGAAVARRVLGTMPPRRRCGGCGRCRRGPPDQPNVPEPSAQPGGRNSRRRRCSRGGRSRRNQPKVLGPPGPARRRITGGSRSGRRGRAAARSVGSAVRESTDVRRVRDAIRRWAASGRPVGGAAVLQARPSWRSSTTRMRTTPARTATETARPPHATPATAWPVRTGAVTTPSSPVAAGTATAPRTAAAPPPHDDGRADRGAAGNGTTARWAGRRAPVEGGAVRVDDGRDASGWLVEFLLQPVAEPSVLVPAARGVARRVVAALPRGSTDPQDGAAGRTSGGPAGSTRTSTRPLHQARPEPAPRPAGAYRLPAARAAAARRRASGCCCRRSGSGGRIWG